MLGIEAEAKKESRVDDAVVLVKDEKLFEYGSYLIDAAEFFGIGVCNFNFEGAVY